MALARGMNIPGRILRWYHIAVKRPHSVATRSVQPAPCNPLQINPLQINPLQINPLQINPLQINPLRGKWASSLSNLHPDS
jgi:hypothetical protein